MLLARHMRSVVERHTAHALLAIYQPAGGRLARCPCFVRVFGKRGVLRKSRTAPPAVQYIESCMYVVELIHVGPDSNSCGGAVRSESARCMARCPQYLVSDKAWLTLHLHPWLDSGMFSRLPLGM